MKFQSHGEIESTHEFEVLHLYIKWRMCEIAHLLFFLILTNLIITSMICITKHTICRMEEEKYE